MGGWFLPFVTIFHHLQRTSMHLKMGRTERVTLNHLTEECLHAGEQGALQSRTLLPTHGDECEMGLCDLCSCMTPSVVSCPEVPEEQPALIKDLSWKILEIWFADWAEKISFAQICWFKSCFWFSIQSVWLRTWLPVIDFALENTQRLRTGCWQRRSACGKDIILPSASAPYTMCAYVHTSL